MKTIIITLVATLFFAFSSPVVEAQVKTKDIWKILNDIGKIADKTSTTTKKVFKTYDDIYKIIDQHTTKEGQLTISNGYPEGFGINAKPKCEQYTSASNEPIATLLSGKDESFNVYIPWSKKKEFVSALIKVYVWIEDAPSEDTNGKYVYDANGNLEYGNWIFLKSYEQKTKLTRDETVDIFIAEKDVKKLQKEKEKLEKKYKEKREKE